MKSIIASESRRIESIDRAAVSDGGGESQLRRGCMEECWGVSSMSRAGAGLGEWRGKMGLGGIGVQARCHLGTCGSIDSET